MTINYNDLSSEWYDKIRDIGNAKRGAGNPGTTRNVIYKNVLCAFDIETSKIPSFIDDSNRRKDRQLKEDDKCYSIMYIWQFQLGLDYTIIGREWDEYLNFLREIKKRLGQDEKLLIYVHNLSFEFQFLAGVYDFRESEVFAILPRKVLKCEMMHCFEYRCSYLQTNTTLSNFLRNMKVEHQKLSGDEYDYSRYRTQETELTEKEIEYAVNDVLGLVEALYMEMDKFGDTFYTIPYTLTGYVRRDTKRAMRMVNRNYVKKQLPDVAVYELLRQAFRGGNTHANRYYSGVVLEDVKSADYSSSYPAVQMFEKFPVTGFRRGTDTESYYNRLRQRGKAVLCVICMRGVELKDRYFGCPYLTKDKSRGLENAIIDNGRILRADYFETTVTDIDIDIILSEYKCTEISYKNIYYADYGDLPPAYKDNIRQYFRQKTTLKGIEEEYYNYMLSKNEINAIYGMSAQRLDRQKISYIDGDFSEGSERIEELLSKAKPFLPYQWGVWTTAHARYNLELAIRMCGRNFVYGDTDSVKYIGDVDWTEFNARRIARAVEKNVAFPDKKGKIHCMGVLEEEEGYKRFVTLGAKKYAYETYDGKTCVTTAGVNKRKGGEELEKAGGIVAYKEGFTFREAGGTVALYYDKIPVEDEEIWINGKKRKITRCVTLLPSTYTLGTTDEYSALLEVCKLYQLADLISERMCRK